MLNHASPYFERSWAKFETWKGEGSLINFVVSLNLKRRHLTSSQKAMIALDILPMLEAEAKERQGARTDLIQDNMVEKFPQCNKNSVVEKFPQQNEDNITVKERFPERNEPNKKGRLT